VVFLDELTQGLDPVARREMWQLIEQARDQGTKVVLVTHDTDPNPGLARARAARC
jgi:ABC-2 type transport system ATP-binding protein